jgi:hypothetical protein
MLKKITQILCSFILATAFVFPSISIAQDYMQLYINPPVSNIVETAKSKPDSVQVATNFMQLYTNPPITNRESSYTPDRKSPLPFGTTADSGMFYDFYFHYQNPKL